MSKAVSKEQAEQVVELLKVWFPLEADYFTLYPAEHEGLPEGSWSIANEAGWEWTYEVGDKAYQNPEVPEGVFLEPIASWNLGVYPA
ncbi:hypothetical protein [Streptomyces phage phiScoe25]|nr:hypothetical protein [Streptomyces phage phiScoe25]